MHLSQTADNQAKESCEVSQRKDILILKEYNELFNRNSGSQQSK